MLDKFLKSDFPEMFTNWAFLIVWMLFFLKAIQAGMQYFTAVEAVH